MAAHLKPIYKRPCRTCGKAATQTLCNTQNAPCGDYCATHGKAALRAFRQEHQGQGDPDAP